MELSQYARALWRWWWLILLSGSVSGTVVFAVSQWMAPTYQASTTLLIRSLPAGGGATGTPSPFAGANLPQTIAELLLKRPVLEAVIARLDLDTSPEALVRQITVTAGRDTPLLVLIVEDSSPQRAADIANETVRVFSQQSRQLQASSSAIARQTLQEELAKAREDVIRTQASLDALRARNAPEQTADQLRLQVLLNQYQSSYQSLLQSYERVRLAEVQQPDLLDVIEAAQPVKMPVRPRPLLFALLAAVVGALLALGLVALIEHFDDSVRSGGDVEQLIGVPTVGAVARIHGSEPSARLVAATDPRSPLAETYRMLAAKIAFVATGAPIRTLVVTSGAAREGRSTTAANLAVALAQIGRRVVLVDTDLHAPWLHEFFQQSHLRGVTTVLMEQNENAVVDYLVPTGVDNLSLMPSGPLSPNPAQLLGSQRMIKLIEDLKAQSDVVLFDSPPLLEAVDAMLLAHASDATLLVVMVGTTRAAALARTNDQLVQSGARLLGVVLNGMRVPTGTSYDYSSDRREGRPKPSWRLWRALRWPGLRAGGDRFGRALRWPGLRAGGDRFGRSVRPAAVAHLIRTVTHRCWEWSRTAVRSRLAPRTTAPRIVERDGPSHPGGSGVRSDGQGSALEETTSGVRSDGPGLRAGGDRSGRPHPVGRRARHHSDRR